MDALAQRLHTEFRREKHQGKLAEATWAREKLLLVKPMTFMNRSGDCVAQVVRNKIQAPADLMVVVDDVNLPLGTLRLRGGGSAGGHNGLKSLIERLGTPEFPRLRMGMGDSRAGAGLADYVLARFHPDEFAAVKDMVDRSVEAVLSWIEEGLEPAMNRFNR